VLFLPFGNYVAGVLILISACCFLTLAAALDVVYVLFIEHSSGKCMLASVFMLAGGILFLSAAVFYYPQGDVGGMDCVILGTWVFRIGSLCYLGGSCSSLLVLHESIPSQSQYAQQDYERGLLHSVDSNPAPAGRAETSRRWWLLVVYLFIIGALLYILGGVFSQYLSMPLPGVVAWIIGSVFFVSGAFVQLWEVVRSWND